MVPVAANAETRPAGAARSTAVLSVRERNFHRLFRPARGVTMAVEFAETGATEEDFIIPMKSKRDLLISSSEKGARKLWDGTRAVDL